MSSYSRRSPATLIETIARHLSISREAAASLSIITVAELLRIGVIPPAPAVIETTTTGRDEWSR